MKPTDKKQALFTSQTAALSLYDALRGDKHVNHDSVDVEVDLERSSASQHAVWRVSWLPAR